MCHCFYYPWAYGTCYWLQNQKIWAGFLDFNWGCILCKFQHFSNCFVLSFIFFGRLSINNFYCRRPLYLQSLRVNKFIIMAAPSPASPLHFRVFFSLHKFANFLYKIVNTYYFASSRRLPCTLNCELHCTLRLDGSASASASACCAWSMDMDICICWDWQTDRQIEGRSDRYEDRGAGG